jgi:hypothetical protein
MRRPCEQRSYNAILIAVLSSTYRSRRARSDGCRVKCVVRGFAGVHSERVLEIRMQA